MLFTPEMTRHAKKKSCAYIKSLCLHACGRINSVGVAQKPREDMKKTGVGEREGRRRN